MISGIWFFSLLEVVLCVKYLIQLILRFKIPFLDDNFENRQKTWLRPFS